MSAASCWAPYPSAGSTERMYGYGLSAWTISASAYGSGSMDHRICRHRRDVAHTTMGQHGAVFDDQDPPPHDSLGGLQHYGRGPAHARVTAARPRR